MKRPAAFLDRDGVLNRDLGFVHRREEFEWLPGAKRGVKLLNEAGFYVFVLTNQSGIARGMFGADAVERLHRGMNDDLRRTKAHIDAFYYCPHHPQGIGPYRMICACRKPAPGMLLQAMREWPVARSASFMIGDKDIDVGAARRAGVKGIMIGKRRLDGLVRNLLASHHLR
jgi:D-glycero-D-manno-heptose 1,7-bisphosphate phosphatase